MLSEVAAEQNLAQTGQSSRALGAAALATMASGFTYLAGLRRRYRAAES